MTTQTTYPEFPKNEHQNVSRIINELKEVIAREGKRPQSYEHLDAGLRDLIEHEIIPALEDYIDYDPTPQYLYDNTGGESVVSSNESHAQAWTKHQQLHS